MKRLIPFKAEKISFFILLSFILEDLFCKSFFTIQYTLENLSNALILVDNCATRYGFI